METPSSRGTGRELPVRSGGLSRLPEMAARILLGGIFLWGGVVKLAAPKAFARVISHYDLLPEALLPVAALGLPALETVAGVGVLLGRRWAYRLVTGLLLFFLPVLWFGILKGLNIDCGCFSLSELSEHGTLRAAFVRDWFLLAAALYLTLRHRFRPPLAAGRAFQPSEKETP